MMKIISKRNSKKKFMNDVNLQRPT